MTENLLQRRSSDVWEFFNHLRLIIVMKAAHLPLAINQRSGEEKVINKMIFTFNCTDFCLKFRARVVVVFVMRKFTLIMITNTWLYLSTTFFSSIDYRFASHIKLKSPTIVVKLRNLRWTAQANLLSAITVSLDIPQRDVPLQSHKLIHC